MPGEGQQPNSDPHCRRGKVCSMLFIEVGREVPLYAGHGGGRYLPLYAGHRGGERSTYLCMLVRGGEGRTYLCMLVIEEGREVLTSVCWS